MTRVCVFEDCGWRGLLPFTWLHPSWELVTGSCTTLSRVRAAFPDHDVYALCRPRMEAAVRERTGLARWAGDGAVLFVNGRAVDVDAVARHAREVDGPFALWAGADAIAFRLDRVPGDLPTPEELTEWVRWRDLPSASSELRLISRWWDLIYLNGEMLLRDLRQMPLGACEGTIMAGAHLLDPSLLHVGRGGVVEPGVVVDSRQGPVVIDRGARVGAGSLLVGPTYVGVDSVVKPLSHIGPEVTLGPSCRVGGEVARTVFMGFGNKQHHGFLGHAYVGQWTNLGAGTTNSNLKNTYGNVRVWVDGRMEDSRLTFVGCAIADHAKTAINTALNTGTVIGVSANVFAPGIPGKFIPSFSWGPSPGVDYALRSALATAARVMERRGVPLTPVEEALLRDVWEQTIPERAPSGGDLGE